MNKGWMLDARCRKYTIEHRAFHTLHPTYMINF